MRRIANVYHSIQNKILYKNSLCNRKNRITVPLVSLTVKQGILVSNNSRFWQLDEYETIHLYDFFSCVYKFVHACQFNYNFFPLYEVHFDLNDVIETIYFLGLAE